MSRSTYRLPSHVLPRRYDLQLDARLGREDFQGKLAIALDIRESQDTIDLHARDLDITHADLVLDGQRQAARINLDPENERVVFQFSQAFDPGEALLEVTFAGKVNQSLKGLYLAQNRPEQVLCTQCEATDARSIFPCFDEPTFKAQFAFEITTARDATVLANGPLLSVTEHDSSKTWKFAATKRMSSYLVALVIGDIASTDEIVVNGIPLKIWSMRGKEKLGTFARDYTARLLPWYEDYFGAPYHFDKYDQVAVPGFSAGAMENSGLVLFRQELLIMAPEASSWKQEKIIAHVIAHEFAHMWFGNRVTMQWWDDLWLNEAFAEWMSYRVISELSPEYRLWDDFEADQNFALGADALENTHPIYSPVQTPAQAEELFDAITYLKGCAVMRMLENFLGQDAFRDGLRTYMQEFVEKNARGADLWRHLQAASHQPVTEIMESWILQAGHPCVTVSVDSANGQHQLQLSQQRFFTNPNAPKDNSQVWRIPLVIRYEDESGTHELRHVFTERTGTVELPVSGELKWCFVNADYIGFYRQNLTGSLLKQALDHLDQLTPREQMGFLGDQWALTRNGQLPISQFLDVLATMTSRGNNYNLLFEIVDYLHTLKIMVEDLNDETVLAKFREWVRDMFAPRMNKLGYDIHADEPREISQQRISVLNAMASLAHDTETIAEVKSLALREAIDPLSVDPNLAATIVTVNAMFGDGEVFKKHVDIYQERKSAGAPPQTVTRYVYSFPAFRPHDLVMQTLSLVDEGIAPKEALIPILRQMLGARHSQIQAWEYIKNNWSMVKEIGLGASQLIKAAGQLPSAMRDDFVGFCDVHVKGESDMSYAQALEIMDLQSEFRSRTKDELANWLNR